MFFYDFSDGYCKCYIYSGCQGSENLFTSMIDCVRTCSPRPNPNPPRSRDDCIKEFANPQFKETLSSNDTASIREIFQVLSTNRTITDPRVDRPEQRLPGTAAGSADQTRPVVQPTPQVQPSRPVVPAPQVVPSRPVVPAPQVPSRPVVPAPSRPTQNPLETDSAETTLANIRQRHEEVVEEQRRKQKEQLESQIQAQREIHAGHQKAIRQTVFGAGGSTSQRDTVIGMPVRIPG